MVGDPAVDPYPAGAGSDALFYRQTQELGLRDIWRIHNYMTLFYSCCSGTYSTFSGIDMVLGTDSILPYVTNALYHTRGLLDHSPLELNLPISLSPKRFCRVNPFWLKVLPWGDLVQDSLTLFFLLNVHTASPVVVWDSMKAYLHGLLIKEIRAYKKSTTEWESFLLAEVHRTGAQWGGVVWRTAEMAA